ncbi:DUF4124 domain-containing protein [Hahella ganghwensis]|uniref:DUF4124 domain-containing protein n=1 Tax=Hahella ganghwensis TaxID=286420 RepID=UPI00037D778A|nr:DUF4124 domain-containing protein [Hahella ganghwensis]
MLKSKRLSIVCLFPLIVSLPIAAEIYQWVDDQGNVEFSDQPREGAVLIEVQDPATISLPKLSNIPNTPASKTQTPDDPYRKLLITFPEDGSAFHSGNGNVTVLTEVAPSLYPNHSLRLSLDGTVVGTSKENFFSLTNINRGTHVLQLDIIDNSSVIRSGPSITFTIHRPSVQ